MVAKLHQNGHLQLQCVSFTVEKNTEASRNGKATAATTLSFKKSELKTATKDELCMCDLHVKYT